MLQRPFSFILSRRSLSTIRPWIMLLLLLMLKAKDGYSQNFTLSIAVTNGSCGNANGAINVGVNPTGPVFPPYTYYILTPLGAVEFNNTGFFPGLGAGAYGITVIDVGGNSATATTPIYVSTGPSISA